jgi:hypothetical protein
MPEKEMPQIVTVFADGDENAKDLKECEVISLAHPSEGQLDFLLLSTRSGLRHIYEVQSLETKYGSYFVGSQVFNNGALHLATRIDPLFFVLASIPVTNTQWQPLDQQLSLVPEAVQSSIVDCKQYHHLFKVNTQLGDDMILYKMSEEKVLQWLTLKQQRAFNIMKMELIEEKRKQATRTISSKSDSFNLVDEDETCTEAFVPSLSLTNHEEDCVKQHSIQVVCEYLSTEWRNKFLTKMGTDESCLAVEEAASKKRPREVVAAYVVKPEVAAAKPQQNAQSAGLKRLKKVSTKGMHSLASFFGASKKN